MAIELDSSFTEKLILIGFDGGHWPFLEHLMEEGQLLKQAQLMANWVYAESIPVLP